MDPTGCPCQAKTDRYGAAAVERNRTIEEPNVRSEVPELWSVPGFERGKWFRGWRLPRRSERRGAAAGGEVMERRPRVFQATPDSLHDHACKRVDSGRLGWMQRALEIRSGAGLRGRSEESRG